MYAAGKCRVTKKTTETGKGVWLMSDERSTRNWDAESVRRAQSEQQQNRPRRKHRRRRRVTAGYFLFVFAVSAVLAGLLWLAVNDICSFNKPEVDTVITVTENDKVGDVTDKLKEAGLINYKGLFRTFCTAFHASKKIGPGVYNLNSGMDYRALVNGMIPRETNMAETVRITIHEGATVEEIIQKLADSGVNTVEALTDAACNADFGYSFVDNRKKGSLQGLEGYLFPDTYDFYKPEDAASALKRLVDNFYSKVSTYLDSIDESSFNLNDVVIMASIIEAEAGSNSERANVSSVIHNRLKSGMTLGMESTLRYAAKIMGKETFGTDLNSPYNTYVNAGLPAGAICNPGLSSIEAAVDPAETDYYYFALGKDEKSHFFESYASFNAFVNSSEYAALD